MTNTPKKTEAPRVVAEWEMRFCGIPVLLRAWSDGRVDRFHDGGWWQVPPDENNALWWNRALCGLLDHLARQPSGAEHPATRLCHAYHDGVIDSKTLHLLCERFEVKASDGEPMDGEPTDTPTPNDRQPSGADVSELQEKLADLTDTLQNGLRENADGTFTLVWTKQEVEKARAKAEELGALFRKSDTPTPSATATERELAATKRALYRWQHGEQVEGDFVDKNGVVVSDPYRHAERLEKERARLERMHGQMCALAIARYHAAERLAGALWKTSTAINDDWIPTCWCSTESFDCTTPDCVAARETWIAHRADNPEPKPCRDCNGTGVTGPELMRCGACKGEGTTHNPEPPEPSKRYKCSRNCCTPGGCLDVDPGVDNPEPTE